MTEPAQPQDPTCQAWDIGYPAECTHPARYLADVQGGPQFKLCSRHRGRAWRANLWVGEIEHLQQPADIAQPGPEPDDGGLFTLPAQPQTGGQHL